MEDMNQEPTRADAGAFAEKRSGHRRRMFKGGKLSFNNGYGAMECVVRNISDGGALLSFGDTSAVPSAFNLSVAGEASRPARVRWRRETAIGVEFQGA